MGMNPLGGGVNFVGEQEFFVKAFQVIVKVTFSIWRLLSQKVIMKLGTVLVGGKAVVSKKHIRCLSSYGLVCMSFLELL